MVYATRNLSIGDVTLVEEDGYIVRVVMGENNFVPSGMRLESSNVIECAFKEFQHYLNGNLKTFTVPFKYDGSVFFKRMVESLQDVEYGNTLTYGELAQKMGSPKAARAVGRALNSNPVPLLIPCHRIIGANGALVGFGCGLNLKKILLDIEARYR